MSVLTFPIPWHIRGGYAPSAWQDLLRRKSMSDHPASNAESSDPSGDASPPEPLGESSILLLARAQRGDRTALEHLYARYLPRLRRWARGRVPRNSRSLLDTDDLLQDVLLRSIRHVGSFEIRDGVGFYGYLRRGLTNRLRDEYRRLQRTPEHADLDGTEEDARPSPLEEAIGHDRFARYETALSKLRDDEREAVVARLEMGCNYQEVAEALGKSSPDAARMMVARALVKLAQEMGHEG